MCFENAKRLDYNGVLMFGLLGRIYPGHYLQDYRSLSCPTELITAQMCFSVLISKLQNPVISYDTDPSPDLLFVLTPIVQHPFPSYIAKWSHTVLFSDILVVSLSVAYRALSVNCDEHKVGRYSYLQKLMIGLEEMSCLD